MNPDVFSKHLCLVRRVQMLRTEVDWGMRQDPAACRADAAVRLAERGYALAAALAIGGAPCHSGTPAHSAQGMVAQPDASRGAASKGVGSSARPKQALAYRAAANGGQQQEQHDAEAFAWDAGLLANECPLFARKFPANTSERVLAAFGELLGSAGL